MTACSACTRPSPPAVALGGNPTGLEIAAVLTFLRAGVSFESARSVGTVSTAGGVGMTSGSALYLSRQEALAVYRVRGKVSEKDSPPSERTSRKMLRSRPERSVAFPFSPSIQPLSERLTVFGMRQFDKHSELVTGPLRRMRPVLSTRWFSIVTLRADVLDVLSRPDTFAAPYAPGLPKPFVLDTDEEQSHAADWRTLMAAVTPDDFPRLTAELTAAVAQRIDNAQDRGPLDVGSDLMSPVLEEVVGLYLGVRTNSPAQVPTQTSARTAGVQTRWARALFHDAFLNVTAMPSVHDRASRAAAELEAFLDSLIVQRRAAEPASPSTVLDRLLARQAAEGQLSDDQVMGNLMGLSTAWLVNASRASLLALDELLDRPEVLARAQRAAASGDLDQLRHILWELLRFRAISAGLLRICLKDYEITSRDGRRTLLPAGAQVFVGTQSAMFDTMAVPQPNAFRTDRPDTTYLFFGYGLHRCFGEQVLREQLPALLAPLLRLPRLRRASGRAGRMRWDGVFPDGFHVFTS